MLLRERLRRLHPGASGRTLKQWLARGRVRVNGEIVRRGDVRLGDADRVELGGPPPPAFPASLERVWEDGEIIVVSKPPGLLTIATGRERERTAYRALTAYVKAGRDAGARLFIVHRLDRETSGLIVFARSAAAKRHLQEQFEGRTVERGYVAVVEGHFPLDAGTLRTRLVEDRSLRVRPGPGGKEAVTHYRVLERRRDATVLELRLETGRRGQIRAQLAASGHPVMGDVAFGSRRDPFGRLALHAVQLGFVHPHGHRVRFEHPAPRVFLTV